jgi:hypothetical protein
VSEPPPPAPAPPADWYPDPSGEWDFRYWNGHSWTAHVSRSGVAYVDPHTAHLPTRRTEGVLGRMLHDHREEKAERTEVEELVERAAAGDDTAVTALPEAVAKVDPGWLERHRVDLFAGAVHRAVHDDLVDAADSGRLVRIAQSLGTSTDELRAREPEAFDELVIGQANDGRLPVVSNPPILTRRGEQAHGVFRVELLGEVAVREFHGGSRGVSVPMGMGVRYRVGAVRGHSEVVGSQLVAEDAGVLVVTSTRTVFSGRRRTLELRHDRLVDLEQFSDGLRFNVSGRQTTSLFRFARGSSPALAVALVSAARQRAAQ